MPTMAAMVSLSRPFFKFFHDAGKEGLTVKTLAVYREIQ